MKRLANISSGKIDVIRGIENEEYENISKHLTTIYSFEKYNKQLLNTIGIKDEIFEAIINNKTNVLMRLISEFLSAFRTFLDHWETYLKRKFGKESNEAVLFKSATWYEYDNVFAYRFLYELRNYIQHEEFPDIAVSSKINEFEEKHYSLDFNPVELLENGHNLKKVQNDLLDENCKHDLLIIISEVMESLNRINNCAINNLDIKFLYTSCLEVLKYKQFQLNNMTLAILDFPPNYPKEISGKVSIQEFPFHAAENYLKGIRIS